MFISYINQNGVHSTIELISVNYQTVKTPPFMESHIVTGIYVNGYKYTSDALTDFEQIAVHDSNNDAILTAPNNYQKKGRVLIVELDKLRQVSPAPFTESKNDTKTDLINEYNLVRPHRADVNLAFYGAQDEELLKRLFVNTETGQSAVRSIEVTTLAESLAETFGDISQLPPEMLAIYSAMGDMIYTIDLGSNLDVRLVNMFPLGQDNPIKNLRAFTQIKRPTESNPQITTVGADFFRETEVINVVLPYATELGSTSFMDIIQIPELSMLAQMQGGSIEDAMFIELPEVKQLENLSVFNNYRGRIELPKLELISGYGVFQGVEYNLDLPALVNVTNVNAFINYEADALYVPNLENVSVDGQTIFANAPNLTDLRIDGDSVEDIDTLPAQIEIVP